MLGRLRGASRESTRVGNHPRQGVQERDHSWVINVLLCGHQVVEGEAVDGLAVAPDLRRGGCVASLDERHQLGFHFLPSPAQRRHHHRVHHPLDIVAARIVRPELRLLAGVERALEQRPELCPTNLSAHEGRSKKRSQQIDSRLIDTNVEHYHALGPKKVG